MSQRVLVTGAEFYRAGMSATNLRAPAGKCGAGWQARQSGISITCFNLKRCDALVNAPVHVVVHLAAGAFVAEADPGAFTT